MSAFTNIQVCFECLRSHLVVPICLSVGCCFYSIDPWRLFFSNEFVTSSAQDKTFVGTSRQSIKTACFAEADVKANHCRFMVYFKNTFDAMNVQI